MRMSIFAAEAKGQPDTENIRDLKLGAVKLTTVQVTNLPLGHKLNKMGITCLAKHFVKGNSFDITLYVWHVNLTKAKPLNKTHTHPLISEVVT
jgi:hypothetical protein